MVIAGLVPAIHEHRRDRWVAGASGSMQQYSVYILASQKHGTLYVGVTGDLARRAWEHREGMVDGFTKKHNVKRLVHFEMFDEPEPAIQREKSLKKWLRDWKVNLIEKENPDWADLYSALSR